VNKHYRSIPILLFLLCFSVFISIFITGCDKDKQISISELPASVSSTPDVIGVVVKIDPELAKIGKGLFQQNCVFCHQADAIGKPGFAPSLTNKEFLSIASNSFLVTTIRDGRAGTGMPPFSHLGRKQVESIVAYLRNYAQLPDISASVDMQPEAHGDPRLGELWFKQICSTCHGFNGDGYSAGSTGTAIGKAGFLDKVSDGFIRYTIINGRSNTRMLGFKGPAAMADLTDREIDDIISYLRTVPSKS